MNHRSVDLNLIPIFDAIFTEGNLTRAAERMAMSQPAMSNALARLRRQARDPLFLRTAKGMVPTPRAQRMASDFRQALTLIRNGLQPEDFDFSATQRDFSIAVEDYGEAVITPPFMDWLLKTAPRVQARIWPGRSQTIQDELRNGTVDLAVDYFKLEGRGLQSSLLMTDELVSMVRSDHPLVGDSLSVKQYTTLPHVVLGQKSPMVDRLLSKRGLKRHRALEVPHFISMPLIVKSTDFICTLPRRMAMVFQDHFRLKVLKSPIRFPKIPIYMVWGDAVGADPGHTWLRQSLLQLCRRL